MSTTHIMSLLMEQRDKIEAALAALQADHAAGLPTGKLAESVSAPTEKRRGRPPVVKTDLAKPDAPAAKKRILSAEGRQRIIDATKARWAKINAAKSEAAAPKKAPASKATSKKSSVIAAVTPTAEETDFKAKMSAAMKEAWKKRKKAAAKKQAKG